jgi:surface protein
VAAHTMATASVRGILLAAAIAACFSLCAAIDCGAHGSVITTNVPIGLMSFQGQTRTPTATTFRNIPLTANIPFNLPTDSAHRSSVATVALSADQPRYFSAVTSTTTRTATFTLSREVGVIATPSSWIPSGIGGARSFLLPSLSKQRDVFSLMTWPFSFPFLAGSPSVGAVFSMYVPTVDWESGDYVRIVITANGQPLQAVKYRWNQLNAMRGRWSQVTALIPAAGFSGGEVEMSLRIDFVGTEATEFIAIGDVTFVQTSETCLCSEGYTGAQCDSTIDYCPSNPCLNGGTCVHDSAVIGYTCLCPPTFTGVVCERDTTFITTWNTTFPSLAGRSNLDLLLPLEATGTYNFTIDWGDGSAIETVTLHSQALHTYPAAGQYTVRIVGVLRGWRFNSGGDAPRLMSVDQWGSVLLGNSGSYFAGASNMVISASDAPDLSETPVLMNMFLQTTKLSGNLNHWDVSRATDMRSMFRSSGYNGAIGAWNVSSVTAMERMFESTPFDQPIGAWNVRNVIRMTSMFKSARAFNQSIGAWDVSSVIDMSYMFESAVSFNQSLADWDVRSVELMTNMFKGASTFNQPIGTWNVSSVQNMVSMFEAASRFNQPINTWDVRKVSGMDMMFYKAASFNQPLDAWKTFSLRSSTYMFAETPFNQDIGQWVMSRVTTVRGMFSKATAFNGAIGNWDTSSMIEMEHMFQEATSFNQPVGTWDVSKVTTMQFMFGRATAFNQPLHTWNVSKVLIMQFMFWKASAFNQPIGDWDVSKVTNLNSMFQEASSFDQDLSGWCVSQVPVAPTNFALSTSSEWTANEKPVWGTCPV